MATIRRLNNKKKPSFQLIASCGYDSTHTQIRKYSTWPVPVGMTEKKAKREALIRAQQFEDMAKKGAVAFNGTTRFEEYADKWLQAADIAPKTRQRYEGLLTRITAELGHMKLDSIQAHHLEAFYQGLRKIERPLGNASATNLKNVMKSLNIKNYELAESAGLSLRVISSAYSGNTIAFSSANKIASALSVPVDSVFNVNRMDMHLSDRTILHYHRLIAAILNAAKRERILPFNVASEHLRAPKVKRKEAEYLDDKQARQLVELLIAETDIRVKTIIMLLLYSGVRRGELCGIQWDDVDFDKNLIHIRRGSQYIKGQGIVDMPTKTDSSQRSIRLPNIMMKQLANYKKWYSEQKLACGNAWIDSKKLFIQDEGRPIFPDTINYIVKAFRRKYNLPHFSPHSLRHTFSTLQIMAGINIRTIQARTGHSQASTLINTYSHAIKTADEMATQVLDDILMPATRTRAE
jgi:integrase